MIPVTPFTDCTVAVLGLARSGLSAARALVAGGAEVLAWDDDPGRRDAAAANGIAIVELGRCDWRRIDALVASPGVPLTHPTPHPVVALARAAGCEVIGDVELLARTMRGARFVGITGTNGKSTTTALLGHLLASAGQPVQVGGNLGTPVLDLEPAGLDGLYILEMSSYQLDLTVSLIFDVAVLLNISRDHLDRHGGLDGYIAAKTRIFRRQAWPLAAIVGVDDPESRQIHDALRRRGEQRVVAVSGQGPVTAGVFVDRGMLYDGLGGRDEPVADLTTIATLPGVHNWQNAAAAYAACRVLDIAPGTLARGLAGYPGLAHRMEPIAEIEGVQYVNDSKATNAEAAARALASYDAVYWIAGGRAKAGGVEGLDHLLPRVRHAFLIGEAADSFADQLADKVPTTVCRELSAAVAAAHAAARRGGGRPVVLLSPACASFDQFANFEARGDAFRALVAALPGRRLGSPPVLPQLHAGDAA